MRDPRRLIAAGSAVLALVVLALLGMRSEPAGTAVTGGSAVARVVIISVPGLRWQDLDVVGSPHLEGLLDAAGLLSVRAIGPRTSPLEGYLTINAASPVDADASSATLPTASSGDGRCRPDLIAAADRSARGSHRGAVPGALGDALAAAGATTAVNGSPQAVAALMAADGCVGAYSASATGAFSADVTLVELSGLERSTRPAERVARIEAIDAEVGSWTIPDDALVLLVAPSAVDDGAAVTVIGLRRSDGPAQERSLLLRSGSTRADGYVTLADIAPTVIGAVTGQDDPALPASMEGTAMVAAAGSAQPAPDHVSRLADLADRVSYRDRAVGPVGVTLVVLVLLGCLAVAAGRLKSARLFAPMALGLVTATFLAGSTDYHHLPLGVLIVVLTSAAVGLTIVAVSVAARIANGSAVALLAGPLWAVLVIDIVTGGRLQLNTPFGYTPTVAGRFQGFGNLAFGFLIAAALATAAGFTAWTSAGVTSATTEPPESEPEPALRRRHTWAAWVMAVTVIVAAAPRFGSDAGGTIAAIAASTMFLPVLAGRRVRWHRLVIGVLGAVAVVGVLAVIDRSRPVDHRTHLGRFLQRLVDGDGWQIVRRKLSGNVEIFTSSIWPSALVIAVAMTVLWSYRHRSKVSSMVAGRRSIVAVVVGASTAGVVGCLVNDSGIVVPAAVVAVLVAWLIGALTPAQQGPAR